MVNGNLYDMMASTLTSVFEIEHRLVPASNEFHVKLLAEVTRVRVEPINMYVVVIF